MGDPDADYDLVRAIHRELNGLTRSTRGGSGERIMRGLLSSKPKQEVSRIAGRKSTGTPCSRDGSEASSSGSEGGKNHEKPAKKQRKGSAGVCAVCLI